MPVTIARIEEVLNYLNENGESETLKHFGINIETLHRYQRRMRFWETKQPKVLLFDLETSPIPAFVWGTNKQYVPHNALQGESFLICWSAKFLFDSRIMSDVLTPEEARNKDDKRIILSLWHWMNVADVVIAHNGKKFDIPYFNTRCVRNKIAPPSPYQVIDTYEVAKKRFRSASNKLDYLASLNKGEGKLPTDFGLWIRCMEGDQESLLYMQKYNKVDVVLLEDYYCEVRPFIVSHPNMAIYQESHEPSCPTCGSADIDECGHYTTSVNRYLAFRCKNCGSICRSRTSDVPIKNKSGIMHPIAR